MESKRALLVLADISGYTRFIRAHRVSLIHAEAIITELLNSVTTSAEFPLTLNKLEGDAAFLYADVADRPKEAAASVLDQMERFIDVFRKRESEIVSCTMCSCDACRKAGKLRLKLIGHFGEILVEPIGRFSELRGEPPIVVHRLLKNSVKSEEYILLTNEFQGLLGRTPAWEAERITEQYQSLEPVTATAFIPPGADRSHKPSGTLPRLGRRFLKTMEYEWYLLRRVVGSIKPRTFRNLPD